MKFNRIRVITKGNQNLIEFLYPSNNLLVKLRFKLLKNKNLQLSKVNDGSLAFVPKNANEFVEAINDVRINEQLGLDVEKYLYKDILEATNAHPRFKIISVNEIIDIAAKTYNVPDYKFNRFYSDSTSNWYLQRENIMSQARKFYRF